MKEHEQRMREIRGRLPLACGAESSSSLAPWPMLYAADVGFLLSLLDMPIYGPSRLQATYQLWKALDDAHTKGIGKEAAEIMEKYVTEAARIYMTTGVMPTFTVGGKTFNELIQAPCQPLSEDAKRTVKIAANNIRRDTEPDEDEDEDDEGLDTPDLETAVAIPECTCPPDHPLLSGHLPTCPCNRG